MSQEQTTPSDVFSGLLKEKDAQALAWIRGGAHAPYLSGLVRFFETHYGGVVIEAELFGLPDTGADASLNLYAMQLHTDGGRDVQDDIRPSAESSYNHEGNVHPRPSTALPPLLSGQGYAWLAFYDRRLSLPEIIGQSVDIYFLRGQPSLQPKDDGALGNSGNPISGSPIGSSGNPINGSPLGSSGNPINGGPGSECPVGSGVIRPSESESLTLAAF